MNTNLIFSERLLKIFSDYKLSSTQFADKIGVQKSTLSHLLANRNKPSLDLLLKIIDHYPAINLYWLADGRLPMYKDDVSLNSKSILSSPTTIQEKNNTAEKTDSQHTAFNNDLIDPLFFSEEAEIDYIVVLYKDGTFKRYKQK